MVKFIESELVLLKKEIDEMWNLVYNQLDRAGEAVLTLDSELARQVLVRERRVNAFELKIDSDVEDIIALYNPVAIDLRFVLAMYVLFYSEYILFSYTRSVLRCKHTYFFKYISFPVLLLLMAASNISTTIILFSSEDRSVGFTFNSPLTAAFK